MKTVNIRLTEFQAQIVLKLLDHVIDVINEGNRWRGSVVGVKEKMLPIDPLNIGVDNYIDVANKFEEVLENE